MQMTWDCHFFRSAGPPVRVDDLDLFCQLVGHYKIALDRDAETARYHHPDTGVQFEIKLLPPNQIQGGPVDLPGNLQHTGIVSAVPLNCPSLVGAEAIPIILMLCQRLRLLLWHPGMERNAAPAIPDQNALMEAWLRANQDAQDASDAQQRFKWTHEDMANWYRYQLMRTSLEKQLRDSGHEAGVPTLRIVRDAAGNDALRTMVDWLDGKPTVFPPANLVYVRRSKKALFGLKSVEVSGWCELDEVRRVLMPGLMKLPSEGGDCWLLTEGNAEKFRDRMEGIPLREDVSRFHPVSVNQFIDV